MTSGAPWSVKGIDPKAREIAKDLARRSGMTLGEWLNQMILEDEPAPSETARRFASASPQALSAPAFPPRGGFTGAAARRLETPPSREDELERVIDGLDRLSARIEAAEHRSTLAISGIDQSVIGVLARMENAEREQVQIAARFEGALDELRTDQTRTTERLRRIEQEATGHRSAEAMRALESALNKVASHLYEGETRTREAIGVLRRDIDVVAQKSAMSEQASASLVDAVVNRIAERLEQAEARTSGAIRDLEGSFADLDTRLKATEAAVLANPAEQRLDLLASELAQRVDQVRLDMVEQIKASAEGRGERMERTLREMSGHVQAAEKRSAQAIEHMGQEVLRMADTLNQKIQGAEHRSAEAIDHVGAEVSRVAHAVEQRIGRADGAQAEALEKLGSEIARITERLAERIANAERRSAHAIDDVGEQMARVTERFNQRQERASSELLDRMRQSEERTARLLDEAREKIDRRLSESQRTLVEQVKSAVPTPAPPPAVRAMPPPLVSQAPYADPSVADPFPASPFHASAFPEPAADPYAADAFSASADDFRREELAPSTDYFADDFPTDPEPPPFTAEDFDNAPGFAHDDSPFQTGAPVARHDQPEPRAEYDAAATRSASTRELIAAARAAARQASQPAEAKARDPGGSAESGLGRFGRKKKEGSAARTALAASGVVAALGITAAGYVLLNPDVIAGWSNTYTPAKPAARATPPPLAAAPAPRPAPPSEETSEPLAATLTTDPPGSAVTTAAAIPAADAVNSSDLYNQAKDKIKAKDSAGLELLRKAANLGYAPAQFYLAKLYEEGDAGLKKDMVEARRWTQRAANSGDPKAMHNLGLYYFHGDGGTKNVTLAASWFRRAADLGLVDSQYNLAQLYEQGLGVGVNPAEAYKWFLIAARSGDGESKVSAEHLKNNLTTSAQQAAERAAQAFRAESPNPAVTETAAAPAPAVNPADPQIKASLALAQKALSKLGYYKGPEDGSASPALRLAIASYQKALGMSPDGALNPQLVEKFTAITR